MNCPVCDAKLREVTKMGVQVDICPDCKGVWLDRGELEKIIEMAAPGGAPAQMPERAELYRNDYRGDDHRGYQEHDKHRHDDHKHDDHKHQERRYDERGREIDPRTGRPKRREGILGEIFDMFGGD